MSLMEELRSGKSYVLVLIGLALAVLAVEVALNGFATFPDTKEYLETVKWFENGSGQEFPLRIQRPLQMLIVAGMAPLFGVTNSFAFSNAVFFIISVPFFFAFSSKMLNNQKFGFYSSLLFIFAFPVLYWGLALLTDMLTWLLLSVGFFLLLEVKESWKTRDVYLLSAVIGIGVLNKESLAALALILVFLFLLKFRVGSGEFFRRVALYIPALLIMALPFLIVQVFMYTHFGPDATFFSYHLTHKTDVRGELWYLPLTVVIAFNILLVLYVFGLRPLFRTGGTITWRQYLVLFLFAFLPALVFEQFSPRLSFVVYPLVLPVAAIGLEDMATRLSRKHHSYLVYAFFAVYATLSLIAANYGDELRALLGIWAR